VALQKLRYPSGDGFGPLDMQEVTDAVDPALLGPRER
jgi:hypothetical protein